MCTTTPDAQDALKGKVVWGRAGHRRMQQEENERERQ